MTRRSTQSIMNEALQKKREIANVIDNKIHRSGDADETLKEYIIRPAMRLSRTITSGGYDVDDTYLEYLILDGLTHSFGINLEQHCGDWTTYTRDKIFSERRY